MKYGHAPYPSSAVTASRCTGNSGVRNIRFAFPGALATLLVIANITTTASAGFPPPASSTSIAITPSEAGFGNVAVGTSRSQAIKITNKGSARIEFNSLKVSGSGFTLVHVPSSLTVAVGTSITFNVVFAPRSASKYAASVSLVFRDRVMAAIPLSGVGVSTKAAALPNTTAPSANVEITPSGASFGNVPVGISNSQTIRIENNGTVRIEFNRLAVSGPGFKIADAPSDLSLGPHSWVSFNVVFTPPSASRYSASVALATPQNVFVASIPLSGTGVSPNVSLSANTSSLSFGEVGVGTKSSSPVTLTNNGNSNVIISGVTITGAGFSASGITSGMVLKPGQSAALVASLDPTLAGAATGKISIASNAPSLPISLSGTGVKSTTPSVSLRWQAASNILGYFVYRASNSGGPYARLTPSVVSSLQYVDSMVVPGQTYYYVVTSIGSDNVESSYSNQAEAPIPVTH